MSHLNTPDPDQLKRRLSQGITQAELSTFLGIDSKDVSKLVRRLLKRGYVNRKPELYNKRWTYRLHLARKDVASQEIRRCIPGKGNRPKAKLDFVAPDLTPRIRQLVDLRLAGHTIREIAEMTNLSPITIQANLRYAREPEKFFHDKLWKKQRDLSLSTDKIQRLLSKDGIAVSNEKHIPHFKKAAERLVRLNLAQSASFPSQKKYFGRLASSTIVYSDRNKAAKYIAELISDDVFENFDGFRRRSGGVTYSLRGFRHALNGIFPADREMADNIWRILEKTTFRTIGDRIEL